MTAPHADDVTDMAHPRRGGALLVVLVFAALISSLAIASSRTMLSGASAAAVFVDTIRADELGRAATQLVAYRLQTEQPGLRRGGAFAARLPSAQIDIDYVAETSRIDINLAPPKLLAALFVAGGAAPSIADDIASRAERTQGRKPMTPSRPAASANAPATQSDVNTLVFVRTEQIIDAWGMPASLYRIVRPALTVASRSAKVDPLLADRLVILALMQGDEERTVDFLERRRHGFANADEALAQLPTDTRTYAGFPPARAVKAAARVTIAQRFTRRYEFVMSIQDGPNTETRVLSWLPLDR